MLGDRSSSHLHVSTDAVLVRRIARDNAQARGRAETSSPLVAPSLVFLETCRRWYLRWEWLGRRGICAALPLALQESFVSCTHERVPTHEEVRSTPAQPGTAEAGTEHSWGSFDAREAALEARSGCLLSLVCSIVDVHLNGTGYPTQPEPRRRHSAAISIDQTSNPSSRELTSVDEEMRHIYTHWFRVPWARDQESTRAIGRVAEAC